MRWFGLQFKLLCGFVLLGVVPAALGSAYWFTVARDRLMREATANVRTEVNAAAARVAQRLEAVRNEVAVAAKQLALSLQSSDPLAPPDFASAARMLTAWHATERDRSGAIFFIDRDGTLRLLVVSGEVVDGIASESDQAISLAARSASERAVVSGGAAWSARLNTLALTYAAPVTTASGSALGSLHAEMAIESLGSGAGFPPWDGASGWLLDDDSRMVWAMRGALSEPLLSAAPAPEPLARVLSDHQGLSRIDLDGVPLSIAWRSIPIGQPAAPWLLALGVPESTLAREIGLGVGRALAVSAATAGAVVLLALWISAWITRPIRRMEEGARRMAQGELDLEWRVETRDELAQVARSFSRMAYDLKRAQDRLVKTERLAAIGEASVAAHQEINHPLAGVMESAESLQSRDDLSPEARTQVTLIAQGAARMRETLRTLERVAGRDGERAPTSLSSPAPDGTYAHEPAD